MLKRLAVITAVMCAVAVAVPAAASAATRGREQSLRRELDATTKDLVEARDGLDEVGRRLAVAERQATEYRRRLGQARGLLNRQAASAYRSGGMGAVSVLFDDEPDDAVARLGIMDVLMLRQREAIADARFVTAAYEAVVKEIQIARGQQRALLTRREAAAGRLKVKFDEAQRAAAERADASFGAAAVPVVSGAVACPVGRPHSFTDTWGAGRSGGRAHKGVDMMAPHGTPEFAYTSGVVTRTKLGGSLGGIVLYLRGNDGNEYYYAHLSKLLVRAGQRVRVGELVGRVGSTGNASASAPHLHFEVHRGGGYAVNPYPYVKGSCG
jgi:peptidoglycan LD-endopeptidase LytH